MTLRNKIQVNAVVRNHVKYLDEVRTRIIGNLGEYGVLVTDINVVVDAKGNIKLDKYNRAGNMTIMLPEDFAEVKVWIPGAGKKGKGEFQWMPAEDYDYDSFKGTFQRAKAGSGFVTLPIRVDAQGVPYVKMPVTKHQTMDVYYEQFRIRDIRIPDIFISDNIHNLSAILTTAVRFQLSALTIANPDNRNGMNQHCGNCRFMQYVQMDDGIDADRKNKIGDQGDSQVWSQFGFRNPQWICTVHKDWADLDAIMAMGDAEEQEQDYVYEEDAATGKMVPRRVRSNEIVVAGKAVSRMTFKKEHSAHRTSGCGHYHQNEKKADTTYSAQKARAKEGQYVSKYWTERAEADRMVIESLVNVKGVENWMYGYPVEAVTSALEANPEVSEDDISVSDIRFMGLGGIMVYLGDDVLEETDFSFVPEMEELDVADKEAAEICSIIYNTVYNFADISEEKLEVIMELIEEKPEGLSRRMSARWDSAIRRLVETIEEHQNEVE